MAEQTEKRWTWRRRIWTCSALGIGGPLAWAAWLCLGWPAAIQVGYDTTRLVEPVSDEGYLNYFRFAKDDYEAAGGESSAKSPWVRLEKSDRQPQSQTGETAPVRYVDSLQAQQDGASRSESDSKAPLDEILQTLEFIPWSAEQFPEAAAEVHANEAWFAYLKSIWRPQSIYDFRPRGDVRSNFAGVVLSGVTADVEFSSRIRRRICLRIGSGNYTGAFEDLDLSYRIACRQSRCVIEWNLRTRMEMRASRLMLIALLSCHDMPANRIQRIERLPSQDSAEDLIHTIDHWERLVQLDLIQEAHRTRRLNDWITPIGTYQRELLSSLLHRVVCNQIDYNDWMRAYNAQVDGLLNLMRSNSWQECRAELDSINRRCAKARTEFQNMDLWTPWPATQHAVNLTGGSNYLSTAWNSLPLRTFHRRAVQIVARLAVWKQNTQSFPDQLDPLLTMPEFGKPSENLLRDPWSGERFVYRTDGTGFELRSVGVNQRVDAGGIIELRSTDQQPRPGMPDDIILKWPVDSWTLMR